MKPRLGLVILAGVLAALIGAIRVGAQPAQDPASPQDTAVSLVPNGVTSFALVAAEYKVFWHSAPPICPPLGPQAPADAVGEQIGRIASYGGAPRNLLDVAGCGSNPQIESNIVADADFVYFTTADGLMRLSVYANPGDAPELMNGLYGGHAELAVSDSDLFVLQFDNSNNGNIYRVPKADPISSAYEVTGAGSNPSNLQVSHSFDLLFNERYFVYWLQAGNLHRFNILSPHDDSLASGVTGYDAEGGRTFFAGNLIHFTDLVFYGAGTTGYYYDNVLGSAHGPIYTSTDGTAVVVSLATDDNHLYLIEHRDATCGIFSCFDYVLERSGRSNDSIKDPIYSVTLTGLVGANRLTTDGAFLYWQDADNVGSGVVRRLPNDASALPQINMRVTGLEVTQGIQSQNNAVALIQNRRTFVRMYVRSDGPDVPWVSAQLSAAWDGGGAAFPLTPVNPVGSHLTVSPTPVRWDINQSFLFDLPLDWTTHSNLVLTAELNPNRVPLQTDYSNNLMSVGPLSFSASPRVVVNLVQFSFTMSGTLYTTAPADTQNAVSLVRRLWPIASTPGDYTDGTAGFRPRLWTLYDAGLGTRMNYTADECKDFYSVSNGIVTDDRNLCASAYADNRLIAYRSEQGLGSDTFFYGLIPRGGSFVVRGQAFSSDRVSSGDAQNPNTAAHEITHTAGRNHPFKGSSLDDNVCGNTPNDGALDNGYPYADSAIGPGNNSLEGFEPGDPALKIGVAVLPSSKWFDIIGYCGPRWISDYTYRAIYQFFPHVQAPSPLAQAFRLTPDVAGDWLSAYGVIAADGTNASFDYLRRVSQIASVPPFEPGAYSLRLVDAHGAILADHSFAPSLLHQGGGVMAFGLEVPFVAGTAQIQLIKSPNQIIARRTVSAHAPVVSGVALQGAPNPVTGTVTLAWTASDADGDPLTFDVLYTRDGGATFQPLQLGITGGQTPLDTRGLGGGTGRLRVIASDGVQSAQADSATFAMANKPPTPRIDSPANGAQLQYGQLAALLGEAGDAQDGGVSGNKLVWTDQRGDLLGTSSAVYTTGLPVGTDVITLTATDSLNLSAATHITLTVGDDMKPAGPLLSAGPTAVSWQVAPGTVASQTAQVNIANAGGGSLNWTASSDQAWLTLSALSGSVPFTLTVTANPAGLSNGQTRLAHLTITKPADGGPAQHVVIPIQLAMGDVLDAPVGVRLLNKHVYLPLIRR